MENEYNHESPIHKRNLIEALREFELMILKYHIIDVCVLIVQ